MIEFLLTILQESPLLFAVLVINLIIVAYIAIRISFYLLYKKKPGKVISHFLWRMKARKESFEIKTVEAAYSFVMDSLKKDGLLGRDEKPGLLARKKVLKGMPDGEKKELLQTLFSSYEAKVYGNRRIANEVKFISDFLDRYANL